MEMCVETVPKTSWMATEAALNETIENEPVLVPGTPLGQVIDQGSLAAVLLTGKKWQTGRTLKVAHVGGHPTVAAKVQEVANEWMRYANIKFDWLPHGHNWQEGDIRIAYSEGDGSWSYLGTDALSIPKGEPTMNYGWLTPDASLTEYCRVVLHEFGHMLGMPHEHQSPAGGVPWDREAVFAYYRGRPNYWDDETIEQNIFERYAESQTVFSELDTKSIMMYAIPNSLTRGDFQVGWNTTLSEMDKKFMQWQYPFPQAPKKRGPITLSELLSKGVTERTQVLRSRKPWITAEPWTGDA